MTLMATLKNLPDFEMIFINYSSSTTPDLILKTFDQENTKRIDTQAHKPKQVARSFLR